MSRAALIVLALALCVPLAAAQLICNPPGMPCQNGGSCVYTTATSSYCNCPYYATGTYCEIIQAVDPCNSSPCPPNSICQSNIGSVPPTIPPSYTCTPIKTCATNPCPSGYYCVDVPGVPAGAPPTYQCYPISNNRTDEPKDDKKCCGCTTNVYCGGAGGKGGSGGGGGGGDGVAAASTAALISTVSGLQNTITGLAAQLGALQTGLAALQATASTTAAVAAVAADVTALAARVTTLELARQDQFLYRRRTTAAVDTGMVTRFDVHDHGPALLPGSSTPAIIYNAADDSFVIQRAGQYLLDASVEAVTTAATSEVEYAWQEQLPGGSWSTLPGSATAGGASAVTRPAPAASVVVVGSGAVPYAVRLSALSATGFTRWATGWARVLLVHAY